MSFSSVLLLLLLPISFGQRSPSETFVEERKPNMVVKILDKVLEDVVRDLAENITIPLVEVGESIRVENVIVSIPTLSKVTDGVGSFGFLLKLNVKDAAATGIYHIDHVDIPGLFPIFGRGNFAINVNDVNLQLKVKAVNNFETNKFDFKVDVFDVRVVGSKLGFENLMGDSDVSDFINELIGNLIPNLVKAIEEPAKALLEPLLDFYGNGVVNCIKTQLNDLENCVRNLFVVAVDDITHRLRHVL